MTFNSYSFIFIFLPATLIAFFTVSRFSRNISSLVMLAASLIFYGMLGTKYLPVLVLSVLVNYFVSLRLSRKLWLIVGVSFNFIVLGAFKLMGVLPPGISFFTFTQTAYLVCVFSGTAKPDSLVRFSEYVSFFPYVISGPISDYRDVMPQLKDSFRPNWDNLAAGITLFVLGLFKKVYIADGLAPIVNNLFANSDALTFFEAWVAALGYSMQLYFDFSGYSDMAIAVALMFNVKLPVNFDSPYKSLSIIEFWRRWHMTLGRWIRDYLYIPLGGSREGELKRTRNVILAMLFTGLWHGLGWTFVVWGAMHGVMLAVNHWWRGRGVRLPAVVSWAVTFGCVVVCWVVFRAESLGEAWRIIAAMFNVRDIALPLRLKGYLGFLEGYGVTFRLLLVTFTKIPYILFLIIITMFSWNTQELMTRFKPRALYAAVIIVLAVISFFNFSGITDFLYFRF